MFQVTSSDMEKSRFMDGPMDKENKLSYPNTELGKSTLNLMMMGMGMKTMMLSMEDFK